MSLGSLYAKRREALYERNALRKKQVNLIRDIDRLANAKRNLEALETDVYYSSQQYINTDFTPSPMWNGQLANSFDHKFESCIRTPLSTYQKQISQMLSNIAEKIQELTRIVQRNDDRIENLNTTIQYLDYRIEREESRREDATTWFFLNFGYSK